MPDEADPALEGPPRARFSDRLTAFMLDAVLFSSGYFLTAIAALAAGGEGSGFLRLWLLLWGALFIAYHAWYSADGRRTLGKRALGLQISLLDGQLPDLKTSLLRSAGYLLSSTFLCVGFLWALRGGRAWHDLLAGTWVVEAEARSPMTRKASTAVAWAAALLIAGFWFFSVVIAPSMARGALIAHGQKGVKSVVYLETKFKAAKGAYTADKAELFKFSDEAAQIAKDLPGYIDMATLRLELGPAGLVVEAAALDEKRTLLRAESP